MKLIIVSKILWDSSDIFPNSFKNVISNQGSMISLGENNFYRNRVRLTESNVGYLMLEILVHHFKIKELGKVCSCYKDACFTDCFAKALSFASIEYWKRCRDPFLSTFGEEMRTLSIESFRDKLLWIRPLLCVITKSRKTEMELVTFLHFYTTKSRIPNEMHSCWGWSWGHGSHWLINDPIEVL